MDKPVSEFIRSVKQINKNDHAFRQKKWNWWYRRWNCWMDKMNRKLGITVTSWEVILKALTIKEELKNKSLSALQKWCYRLLVRNHLTFGVGTHIGQEHSENYKEKMFEFIKLIENYRKCNDFELDRIANMDETPLFLNMARTKTIAKIGSKTVNIKTRGQEKFE